MKKNVTAALFGLLITFICLEIVCWLGAKGGFSEIKGLKLLYSKPLEEENRRLLEDVIYCKEIKATLNKLEKEGTFDKRSDYQLGWDKPEQVQKPGGSDTITQFIRGSKYYFTQPDPRIVRIAAFGDSFVYGTCMDEDNYWASMLAESYNGKVEILNFAVHGYGTDQAFLKYKLKGAKYKPDIVIIGLFIENFFRNVNLFRYIYTKRKKGYPIPKPRFYLDKGKLKLIKPMPLKEIRAILSDFGHSEYNKYEYFYGQKIILDYFPFSYSYLCQFISYKLRHRKRIYHYVGSECYEPFKVTLAIVEAFYKEVIKNGSVPFVLLIRSGGLFYTHMEKFHEALENKGIKYLDTSDAFWKHMNEHKHKTGYYEVPDCGHFNETGSRILAEAIKQFLDENKKYFRLPIWPE